jgi:hypothetical protein
VTYPPDAAQLMATLRDGAWLDAQEFPPLTYAVPGLVPEGSVLLVGPPKIGKSWLVLTIALAAASGGKALGLDIPKRPVLYLALEDGDRRLQDRCRRLLGGDPIPEEFQYQTEVQPGRIIDTIGTWLHWQTNPSLVILDTLGKVLPPTQMGEDRYQRDYRVGSALKRTVDKVPGTTLLVNHHDRKAIAEDFVDAVSGTHGLAGAADTIIVLTRDRQETIGRVKVTGRDVAEGEYVVYFRDGAIWELHGGDLEAAQEKAQALRATSGVSDRMLDVVMYAYEHPEGVRRGDVAQALDLDPRQASVYLSRAVAANRLKRAERGLYVPVISVALLSPDAPTDNNATHITPPGEAEQLFDDDDPGRFTR